MYSHSITCSRWCNITYLTYLNTSRSRCQVSVTVGSSTGGIRKNGTVYIYPNIYNSMIDMTNTCRSYYAYGS